jgi:hypothetical protein
MQIQNTHIKYPYHRPFAELKEMFVKLRIKHNYTFFHIFPSHLIPQSCFNIISSALLVYFPVFRKQVTILIKEFLEFNRRNKIIICKCFQIIRSSRVIHLHLYLIIFYIFHFITFHCNSTNYLMGYKVPLGNVKDEHYSFKELMNCLGRIEKVVTYIIDRTRMRA